MPIKLSALLKAKQQAQLAKALTNSPCPYAPSNEPKTPAKPEGTGKNEGMLLGSVAPTPLTPIIDKLSITLTIPPEDLEDIHKAVYTAFLDTEVFQSATKLKGFKSARSIAVRTSAERVHFAFGSKDGKPPHARLEFNPGKLGLAGMDSLWATLTSMMPDGFEYVVKHGRITRLDVAVDIPKTRMHQFLLLPAQGLASTCVYNAKGKLKTVYIGKKEGSQTVLYSKSAEQASKKVFLPFPTVRLERRLRNPKVHSLTQLGAMENPFKALKLVETMPPAPDISPPWVWPLFLDAVAQRGLVPALLLLPEKQKTAYRKHLDQHQVGWWDPDAVWAQWPKALSVLQLPA